jgi:hypothetical protein
MKVSRKVAASAYSGTTNFRESLKADGVSQALRRLARRFLARTYDMYSHLEKRYDAYPVFHKGSKLDEEGG